MIIMIGISILLTLLIGLTLTIYKLYNSKKIESVRLSEILAAFQNFVVAASIVATGLWVIYTFDALNQKNDAELKYQELQKKIEDIQSSNIKLETKIINYQSHEKDPDTNLPLRETGLIIEVTITNKGNTKIEYDLSNKPLKVYKVSAKGDQMGYQYLLEPTLFSSVAAIDQDDKKSIPLSKWVSLTDSSRTLSYFVTIDADSLYYLVFSSPNMNDENKKSDTLKSSTKCNPKDDCKWFVSKYVYTEKQLIEN